MAVRKKTSANCERVAYRFYGIPSDRDAILEDKTFGCCRYLWNRMFLYDQCRIREIQGSRYL